MNRRIQSDFNSFIAKENIEELILYTNIVILLPLGGKSAIDFYHFQQIFLYFPSLISIELIIIIRNQATEIQSSI